VILAIVWIFFVLKRALLILSITFLTHALFAQQSAILPRPQFNFLKGKRTLSFKDRKTDDHSKLVAASLNVSLGLFGVHRLYLGTSPQVPVIYTLTLGGGGFIMLTDLGVILFTKDLEQFADNPRVIMWSDGPAQ
jgi:TM2 domain-containing membrane protein YozV